MQSELDTLRKENEALVANGSGSAAVSDTLSAAEREALAQEKDELQKKLQEAQVKQQVGINRVFSVQFTKIFISSLWKLV